MKFISNYLNTVFYVFSNIFNFKGRSGRTEYWYYFSFMFTLAFSLGIFAGIYEVENTSSIIIIILGLIADVTFVALSIRRLRDAGVSIWWCVTSFAPFIAFPASIMIGLLRTKK